LSTGRMSKETVKTPVGLLTDSISWGDKERIRSSAFLAGQQIRRATAFCDWAKRSRSGKCVKERENDKL